MIPSLVVRDEFLEKKNSGFVELYQDFERNLDSLTEAIKKTKEVKSLSKDLAAQKGLKAIWRTVNGGNDKDIASLVNNLGQSLETTQIILNMVLQIQNTKNKYLKEFHESLVNKITNIKRDTETLDENQKEAVLTIVEELTDQIRLQIEQQEMVEQHRQKLHHVDGFMSEKNELYSEQDEKIKQLESRAEEIIRVDELQQKLIEELKTANASKEELDRIQTQRIDALLTEVSKLALEDQNKQTKINVLESQILLLEQQIKAAKSELSKGKSIKSMIFKVFPGYIALIFSAILWIVAYQ